MLFLSPGRPHRCLVSNSSSAPRSSLSALLSSAIRKIPSLLPIRFQSSYRGPRTGNYPVIGVDGSNPIGPRACEKSPFVCARKTHKLHQSLKKGTHNKIWLRIQTSQNFSPQRIFKGCVSLHAQLCVLTARDRLSEQDP
jgi:hypothetical protein